MDLERILLALLVVAALLGGLWIGRLSMADIAPPGTNSSFREWFWQERGLDLAVQAALVFVGALGTAALLPRDREDAE